MGAQDNLSQDQFSYRGNHQPNAEDFGSPLHEADQMFPDVYSHPEYYSYDEPGEDAYGQAHRAIVRGKGNPEQPTWMYRAMPKDAYETALNEGRHPINRGDWVTPSKKYAQQHRASNGEPDWVIASRRVRARDLRTPGDAITEWGYYPED